MTPISFGTMCTGIAGIDVGFRRQGLHCAWQMEIDKACRTVLRKHFPQTLIYEDAKKDYELEWVNVLAGGTPCQGFGISGLRGGMADERSNLCFRFCQIADRLNPDFVVWENVPGVLSMPDNSFGCFLAALAGCDSPLVHPDTEHYQRYWREREEPPATYRWPVWPRAGMVDGPTRTVTWRVLDSQYRGVAQRRERVFVIASPHKRTRSVGAQRVQVEGGFYGVASKVLFESEMLRRHSPPSRETREDVAATLGASPEGSGWRSDVERMTFVPSVAPPLGAHALSKGRGTDLDNTTYVATHDISPALQERGNKGADSDCIQAHVIVAPLTTRPYADNASQEDKLVVHGFDKGRGEYTGEDLAGTLRCNEAKREGANSGKADNQCVAFQPGNLTDGRGSPPTAGMTPALKAESDGDTRQCVAFHLQQDPISNETMTPALGSGGNPSGQASIGVAMAFRGAGQDGFDPQNISPPLAATDGGGAGVPFMVHSNNCNAMTKDGPGKAGEETNIARSLDTNGGFAEGQGGNLVVTPKRYQVRRLTPVECERLQAFEDDFSRYGVNAAGKQIEQKDSPRYRQLGNAWTTFMADWIAIRIKQFGYKL